jgi:hypothetical protein
MFRELMCREMRSREMLFRKIIVARGRASLQDGFAARTLLYATARRDLVRLAVFS